MSNDYSREVLRRVVAQVCQIIGWQGINSTPLDILVHILEKYILTLCTQTHRYAEQFNRTEPNLHDLGLVFRDVNAPLQELREYIRCVPPAPCHLNVSKFPIPKESHLNFLKPGSQEVVTRPVHVHEYLPAMHPDKEVTPPIGDTIEITHNGIIEEHHSTTENGGQSPEISVTDDIDKPRDVFKRPTDPISFTSPGIKRPRLKLEEEDSRTREISSVMMTMSGYLSPAREGKLPEARTPVMIHHQPEKPKLNPHHNTAPPRPPLPLHKSEHFVHKSEQKKSKKNKSLNGKVEKVKKKDKSHKNLVPGKQKNSENKTNKLAMHLARGKLHPSSSVKQHVNEMPPPLKQLPPLLDSNVAPMIKQEIIDLAMDHPKHTLMTLTQPLNHPEHNSVPHSQLLRNPMAFTEHTHHHKNSNVHNTPPILPPVFVKEEKMDDEKLTSVPDRSKLNIFKKISSKVKEEKGTISSQDRLVSDYGIYDVRPNHSIPSGGVGDVLHDRDSHKQKMHHVTEVIDSVVSNSVTEPLPKKSHPSSSGTVNENINVTRVPVKQEIIDEIPKDLSKPKLMSPLVSKSGHKEKKEKKHKDRKSKPDKALKELTKMIKKNQMAQEQLFESQEKMGLRIPPNYFLPGLLPNLPGPGLLPSGPGLIPGGNLFSGIPNPMLRGMLPPDPSNLLPNPFSLNPGDFPHPDLFPGPGLIPHNLSNPLLSQIAHSFGKPPPLPQQPNIASYLRRPSLEVIPIEGNSESKQYLSPPLVMKEKDKPEKVKIPHSNNNMVVHNNNNTSKMSSAVRSKTSTQQVNSSLKVPYVKPDVTIEVNVPEKHKALELPKQEFIPPPVTNESTMPIPPIVIREKDKDKSEKKKDKLHKKEKKDKDMKIKKKKDKKDKLKIKIEKKKAKEEKQEKERLKKEKKEKRKEREKEKEKEKLSVIPEGLVPKLTLKLGSSSPMPPSSPETTRKLNIKPILKKDDPPSEEIMPIDEPTSAERAHSPELARISALVTRPPKMKPNKHNSSSKSESSSDLNSSLSPPPQQSSTSPHRKSKSSSSYSRYKRIYFKPIPKKGNLDESVIDFDEDLPPPTPPVVNMSERNPSVPAGMPFYTDSLGNKIWICPACGQQDNGSPMIGCDGGCDGWYHWECVGIRVAPDDNEDWYCMACKAKRAAMASALAAGQTRKKRGRKPKAEKLKEIH